MNTLGLIEALEILCDSTEQEISLSQKEAAAVELIRNYIRVLTDQERRTSRRKPSQKR